MSLEILAGLAGLAIGAALLLVAVPLRRRDGAPVDQLVRMVAAGAAVGAALAPGAPTGWEPLDLVLRAALGAAVTLSAGRAGRDTAVAWATAVAAAVVVLVPSPLGVLAAVGLGLVVAQAATGQPSPVLRAAGAALAVQSLLRLDWPLASGLSALVALVALVPLLVAGYRTLPRRPRLVVRRAALGVGIYCVAGTVLGLLAAFGARSDIERGMEAGISGLDAIGGDAGASQAQLEQARAAFRQASDELGAIWVKPVYAVPFVAQQARAVRTMAAAGADLSADALATLEVVDPATLSPRGGQIDLAAVASLAAPLDAAASSLARAQRQLEAVSSPWLLGPLAAKRAELAHEVVGATSTAVIAADAADLLPAMLGGDGLRRYLLVVQTPAEARGSGGFMGNWGEITAVDGRLELSRFGRVSELNDARLPVDRIAITGEDAFIERYGADPTRTWGVNNFSPDFASVGRVMAQLYPLSGGQPVDGVIAIDPYGLAALLDAVGRVEVEGWPDRLGASNVAQVLLHEQYLAFDNNKDSTKAGKGDKEGKGDKGKKGSGASSADDTAQESTGPGNQERKDFLGDTAQAVFEKLVGGGFESPASLAGALAPAVAGRHLQFVAVRDEEHHLFELLDATGSVPELRGDSVGVVGQNYGGNKIDWFLSRTAAYDVVWDPATGSVTGELEVQLTNAAPASGLPDTVIGYGGTFGADQTPTADGENLMLVSLYSAFPLEALTLDGEPLGASLAHERGRHVYTAYVSVPSGGTRTVRATTHGAIDPGQPYTLDPVWQPVVTPDQLEVTLRLSSGWRVDHSEGLAVDGERVATARWTLDGNRSATVRADRAGNDLMRRVRGDS